MRLDKLLSLPYARVVMIFVMGFAAGLVWQSYKQRGKEGDRQLVLTSYLVGTHRLMCLTNTDGPGGFLRVVAAQ